MKNAFSMKKASRHQLGVPRLLWCLPIERVIFAHPIIPLHIVYNRGKKYRACFGMEYQHGVWTVANDFVFNYHKPLVCRYSCSRSSCCSGFRYGKTSAMNDLSDLNRVGRIEYLGEISVDCIRYVELISHGKYIELCLKLGLGHFNSHFGRFAIRYVIHER